VYRSFQTVSRRVILRSSGFAPLAKAELAISKLGSRVQNI
jgi:hypothetical protein